MVTKAKPRKRSPKAPASTPRDRDATRERILEAVGRVLARDGFSGLGVNAVAREAGTDKVLIYRYFGGIDALLDTWGRTALGQASDAAGAAVAGAGGPADRAVAALLAFGRNVRRNPEALEVTRWELVEDNPLTRRLAGLREAAGAGDLARVGLDTARAAALDLPAVAAVLSAGLLHVALRAKTATHWLGIPIRTEEGWARLERAAASLVRSLLGEGGSP